MNLKVSPVITTDGFKFYQRVMGRVFGQRSLRSGDQDAPERSGGQGGAKSGDRSWAIAASSAGLGGLTGTEHVFC